MVEQSRWKGSGARTAGTLESWGTQEHKEWPGARMRDRDEDQASLLLLDEDGMSVECQWSVDACGGMWEQVGG